MEFVDELNMLKEQLKFKERVEVPRGVESIVVAGMGGSGISGKIFSEFYSKKPVSIADAYDLPDFVSKSTLVIAISYSGNTEETLSMVREAVEKGAHTVTISSGGELADHGDQHIRIPRSDLQPRSATGWMLLPLLYGFDVVTESEVKEARGLVDGLDRDNSACMAHARAIRAGEHIPVIYGSSPFNSVAYRWKTQFAENSKVLAYSNSFPELNHNDTMALAKTYRKGDFYFLVFSSLNAKISKRIAVTARITGSKFNIIESKGGSDVARMFYLLHYGDYLSYHLGLLRKVDPTDISLIALLKKSIK
jgi:glucose/mannose-6-phosphate isomerase